MLKILERDYKQTQHDIEAEFPNSFYYMIVDNPLDTEGYLLAVSTSRDSDAEFCQYRESLNTERYVACCGSYGEAFNGLYSVE